MRFYLLSVGLVLCIFTLCAPAAESSTDVTLEGVVTQFDEKTITIKQKNNAIVILPRTAYSANKGIVTGKTLIKTKVSASDFLKYNRKYFGRKKTENAAQK